MPQNVSLPQSLRKTKHNPAGSWTSPEHSLTTNSSLRLFTATRHLHILSPCPPQHNPPRLHCTAISRLSPFARSTRTKPPAIPCNETKSSQHPHHAPHQTKR